MGIMIYRDKQAAGAAAATIIASAIIQKPNAVIGLTASSAALTIYKQLAALTGAGVLDWSEVSTFHASEIITPKAGLGAMSSYLSKYLYQQVDMHISRVHAPQHNAQNMELACTDFEGKLVEYGGLDVLLLRLGKNGHIALNGPAREFSALTHVELLPESTAEECAAMFPGEARPAQAITMGMSTMLSAKKIILCAFGEEISGMVARMLSGTITPAVPASMLQFHADVTFMLDEDAAAQL